MSCPNCGNELQTGEAFCGLCGTPSRSPTGLVTYSQYDSIHQPQGRREPGDSSLKTQSNSLQTQHVSPPDFPSLNHNAPYPSASQHDFHQTATEAFVLPRVQTGNLRADTAQPYPQQPISSRQSPSAQTTHSHTVMILSICICIVVALIGAVSGSILFGEKHTSDKNQTALASLRHATPTLSMSDTPTPTPVPTVQPTPALAPTPVPDAGFIYCGVECNPYGFMDEYPAGWQMTALPAITGIQFVNPLQPDQVMYYKKLNMATTPEQLLANEIQTMYAGQPGYQPTASPQPQTIGGQVWLTANIGYQSNQQQERVTVCASVYQNQSYILELQASYAQFDQVSVAYYNLMVGKFQFS